MDFKDRYGPWALITGASEGTGREFARQIAAKGVPCVLVARREGPLKDLAAEIKAESGVECVTATVDLAAPDAGERLIAAAGGREIGLFVANAGADPNGSNFLDRDVGAWRDLTQRNVLNVLEACHHFGGLMRGRGRGGLLIVGSGACYGGASHLATYSATKAFQLCLAEGLWAELRPFGRVCRAPGGTRWRQLMGRPCCFGRHRARSFRTHLLVHPIDPSPQEF